MSNFPTIFDWLERLDFLRGFPAAYALAVAAAVVVIVWDWRLALLALAAHYLAASLLYIEVLEPRLAIVKLFVGLFVCLMLYITGRQVDANRLPSGRDATRRARDSVLRRLREIGLRGPAALLSRTVLTITVALLLVLLSRQSAYRLPAIPAPVNLSVYVLLGLGLLSLGLATEPMKAALGLLLFISGFELFYSALDQSALTLTLLAVANLMIALVVAFLAQVKALSKELPAQPSPLDEERA